MSEPALDQWAEWLVRTRFAESTEEEQTAALERLAVVRERVLDGARIELGDFVVDVGAGTGLLAVGALDRVGPNGDVMAMDVSVDCLEELERSVRDGRLWFLIGDAAVLPLPGELVDAVLTRSVLIYVEDRAEAAREFLRVLRPGGRVSLFEPVNSANLRVHEAVDLAPLGELGDRVAALEEEGYADPSEPMVNVTAADLERFFVEAGFEHVAVEHGANDEPQSGRQLLYGVGAPGRPALVDRWRDAFSAGEVERLVEFFEPRTIPTRWPFVYLTAQKPG